MTGKEETGSLNRVTWTLVERLIKNYEADQYRNTLHGELMEQDATRFARLKPLKATITAQPEQNKPISDLLIGIFFENINYSVDGGSALINEGFDGITLKKGERYDFSLFGKVIEGKGWKLLIRLLSKDQQVMAEATVNVGSKAWKQSKTVLTAKADATLSIEPEVTGSYELDLISLFPQKTFKNRKNGLRADLAQTLADTHPRFMSFPGSCVAHGDGIHNIYRWKNTIGPLQARKPQRNLWDIIKQPD